MERSARNLCGTGGTAIPNEGLATGTLSDFLTESNEENKYLGRDSPIRGFRRAGQI